MKIPDINKFWFLRKYCSRAVIFFGISVFAIPPSFAAQNNALFNVNVQLAGNSTPSRGICRSSTLIGAFGVAITVLCSNGMPVDFSGDTTRLPWASIPDGSYRFVTLLSSNNEPLGTLDFLTGAGTVTTWRMVKMSNLDYLELSVGW